MSNVCRTCGRVSHKGLCNLVELSNGKIVHADRVDALNGELREAIERGDIKIVNRWIKTR